MSLLSKIRTSINAGLVAIILSSGVSAQPLERASNWPYDQHVPEQTYTGENLPNATLDFSITDSTNTITVDITDGDLLKEIGFVILSEDGEIQFSNINWQPLPNISGATLKATSSPFIYLPDTTNVTLLGKDFQDNMLFLAESTYVHENRRTLLIDRNGKNETLYMIEGSGPFPLGYLVNSTPVSTGLITPEYETPIGFFSIWGEKLTQWCDTYSCWINFASWYTPGRGFGIHEGYNGTDYGRPASHGCTRIPEKFIENLWEWRNVGDNVIYIGATYGRNDFVNRFDFQDYYPFIYIIASLNQYRNDIKNNNVERGYYLKNDFKFIEDVTLFSNLTNEGCQRWQAVEYGGDLFNFITKSVIPNIFGYNPENFNIQID